MLSSQYATNSREDGFTLIELLIVVIIIGILAAIALPIFIDQQKIAIDATVKSDVRNSVTNITNAQGQALTEVRAVLSRDETKVALSAIASGAGVQSTVVASKASPTFTNVPVLGTPYTVQGWNAGGKQYLGSADAGKGAYSFDSTTGKFTQASGAAPSTGGSSTGGSAASNPNTTFSDFEAAEPADSKFSNIQYASDRFHSGARSAYVQYRDISESRGVVVYSDSNMTVGKKYTISGWYYADTTRTTDKISTFFPGAEEVTTDVVMAPGVWTSFSTTITVPASLNTSFKQFYIKGSDPQRTYSYTGVYFDDLSVTPLS